VTAALGTGTDGSIVCPSSICGIVGIAPTAGLVSRTGVVPIAYSLDTVGPRCRTVADAAAVLSAIVEPDPEPAAIAGSPLVIVPAGYAFGLPVGITFMGCASSEPTRIRLA
jgi:amidase